VIFEKKIKKSDLPMEKIVFPTINFKELHAASFVRFSSACHRK
jgi:hypothetical protein